MARHLLVTNDFPPKTGGIQVYLHELWRRLEPGRAAVLTATSHPDAPSFDETSGVVTERVATKTLFWPSRKNHRAIEAAIARHDPALVLLDPVWPLGLLGPFLSRPYGVVVHGAEVAIPARLPLVRRTLRFVLARAVVVVAAGGYPEGAVRALCGRRTPPVVQVPPGVDVERFHPVDDETRRATRAALSLADDDVVVASFSRLVPRKGMDTLIAAAAQLRARYPRLVVTIGGAGRDRRRLAALAKSTNAPVRFLGRVDDDVLPAWLAASDLMVMDCRRRWGGLEEEGFGIVFVEAAACGLAAVAGRSGGSHEAVRHEQTGLVVDDPTNVDALAHAIATLVDDDERRRAYGRAARAVAEVDGDWRVLAARLGEGLAPFDGFATSLT